MARGAAGLFSIGLIFLLNGAILERFARARAARTGQSVAAYLAIVAPRARARGPAFQPARLLAQARALTTLPPFAAGVEVYRGTAPLIQATARPLPPEVLDSVRRGESGGPSAAPAFWFEGRALVALVRPGDTVVSGVVAVSRRPDSPRVFPPILVLLALGVVGLGWKALREGSTVWMIRYSAAALLFGLAAGIHVRLAARASVDGWLLDARLLLQEAVARRPGGRVPLADLSRIAPGATLSRGAAAPGDPRRLPSAEGPIAAVAVRLNASRWLELRTAPAQPPTGHWLGLFLLLAAAGPAAFAAAHWSGGCAG